jgi:rare lipoprotein A
LRGSVRRPARAGAAFAILGLVLAGSGCGDVFTRAKPQPRVVDHARIEDAVPRTEALSRYGNPEYYEVEGRRYYPLKSAAGYVERGVASWYGSDFHGRRTSSGEPYDMHAMTAAHRLLPLPTYVQVRNVANGAQAVVRVNDRGPFKDNRIIDLSYAAATKLGVTGPGTALVELRAIDPSHPEAAALPAPAPALTTEFFLQAGAFRDAGNAERLRQRLAGAQDAVVTVTSVVIGGTTLHRVRIGPLTSVDSADRIVATLARAGIDGLSIAFD